MNTSPLTQGMNTHERSLERATGNERAKHREYLPRVRGSAEDGCEPEGTCAACCCCGVRCASGRMIGSLHMRSSQAIACCMKSWYCQSNAQSDRV
jgi:hypothetical protein